MKGWKIIQISKTGATTNSEVEGDSYSFVMPECKNLLLTTILRDATGISDVQHDTWTWVRHGDELILCDVASDTRIALYDLRGMLLYQTTATGSDLRIPAVEGRLLILKVGNKTIKIQ